MEIYVDTAKIDEIKEAFSWGIIDGITTNPSLIKKAVDSYKEKLNLEDYIGKIMDTAKGYPVSLEVISNDEESMFNEAIILYEKFSIKETWKPVIKIPINPNIQDKKPDYGALKVIKKLSSLKNPVPVNCTLIMTPEQALLAAKAGAKYVSPFAGRIDDYLSNKYMPSLIVEKDSYFPSKGMGKGKDDDGVVSGVDLISKTLKIVRKTSKNTKVIAASIRNPRQVREIALTGADIATIPFDVLGKMTYHNKTSEGMRKFISDVVPEYKKIFY